VGVVGVGVGELKGEGVGVGVVGVGVGEGDCAIEAYSKDAINPTATSAVITKLRLIIIVLPKKFEILVLNNCIGHKERSHLLTILGMVFTMVKTITLLLNS